MMNRQDRSTDSETRRGHVPADRTGGFSLTELLVVTVVILLVVGLLFTGTLNSAGGHQTRMLLAGAKGVADSYRVESTQAVNHVGTTPFDWSASLAKNAPGETGSAVIAGVTDPTDVNPHNYHTNAEEKFYDAAGERFAWAASQMRSTAVMLPSLGDQTYGDFDGNGFMELVDGWGRKMIYVAFVDHDDGNSVDDFLPERPWPYFASAGPDGKWGDVQAADGSEALERSQDNLYSYEMD